MGPLKPDDLEEGLLVIEEHTKSIVDATFSPEGSALATVSLDGTIKFFQVSLQYFKSKFLLETFLTKIFGVLGLYAAKTNA